MKPALCLTSTASLMIVLGIVATPGVAEAQLVQIGPGYVKAPFVRIYRTPHGTSVRAPFTHVESGAPAYDRHVYHGPEMGSHRDPQGGSFDEGDAADIPLIERQRRLVAEAARQLDRDLLRFRRANHWRATLRLPPAVLDAQPNAERDTSVQPDQVAVQAVLKNFDTVARNGRYRKIAQLRSFRSTHQRLQDYVSLLTLPRTEPLRPTPAPLDQRSILIPPAADDPPEELRLPTPQGSQ